MFRRIDDVYRKCLLILVLCLTGVIPALAQVDYASVSGTVQDTKDARIADAKVRLVNTATGVESVTKTSTDGTFYLPPVLPGHYNLQIERAGFTTYELQEITLNVGDKKDLVARLQVGSPQETVTVDGSGLTPDTTDAAVSTVVDRQFVENMPLNGRSFQNLIALSPGSVMTPTSTDDEGQVSIAGQRAGSNYFTVDGVSANFAASNGIYQSQTANGGIPAFSVLGSTTSLVSVDALQEFRLASSTYAPEFGRQDGGQVALVTRSGTNSFHGTAFDYLRNDVFDASDWFANNAGLQKPRERQNDFGGVIGGPIRKDKTFFFFSYEGLRVVQPTISILDVPSLAARAAAPANIKAFVDSFALPNGPDTGTDLSQYATSAPDRSAVDATSIRIDHALNAKLTLFGRYNYSPSNSFLRTGAPPNDPSTVTQNITTGTAGATIIFSPTLTDDLRFNYSRAHARDYQVIDDFGGAVPIPESQQAASWQSLATGWVCFGTSAGRNTLLCNGALANNYNHQINITDTLELIRGTHAMKFGGDLRRLTPLQIPVETGAFYDWLAEPTFINGDTPDLKEVYQNPANIAMRFYNFSAFAQDTWKVSRHLTMTYGVRWDHNPPPVVTSGNPPYTISQITDLATATLLPPGSPLWHPEWKNFVPRVGLSYVLRPDSNRLTVLRAGVGQFYDLGTSTAGALTNTQGEFPYSLATVLCSFGTGPDCSNEMPYSSPKPAFTYTTPYPPMRAFDPHLKLPYALEWNVAVEQTLSPNQIIKVTYLGSAGRNLLRDDLISNPNPTLSGLFLTRNSSYSNYDALQVQFERRLSRGLQALISYSWSHSIDLNSADVTTGWYATTTIPTNLYNIKQDYGDSDFDVRHTFSAAVTYNAPGKNVQNPFARALLRDWSLDSINSARTASPFNVLYQPASPGAFVDDSGAAIQLRPDPVAGQPIYLADNSVPGGKRLNPAAFVIPSAIRQGFEGRNTVRGFPLVQVDIALRRQFSITERVRLQFRADAFNFINHPNFGNPLNNMGTCPLGGQCSPVFGWGVSQAMLNQSLGSAGPNSTSYATAFGALYQVGGPRSMQIAMKLQF
jgi:Carboxypeptidase regulatory-like domain